MTQIVLRRCVDERTNPHGLALQSQEHGWVGYALSEARTPMARMQAVPGKLAERAVISAIPEAPYLSNLEVDVQKLLLPMIGILTAALACGCNSAKSPGAVATDVAAARKQASTEVTDARKDAAKSVDSAAANAAASSKYLNDVGARAAYDVAIAQADGDHNVAIQQCLALTGEPQRSCKDRVDTSYDQAKIHANVIRLAKLQ
jgi:hypothetical protein